MSNLIVDSSILKQDQTYDFKVIVRHEESQREARAQVTFDIIGDCDVVIYTQFPSQKINYQAQAAVRLTIETSTLNSYSWKQIQGPETNAVFPEFSVLVIPANTLSPGESYVFQLTIEPYIGYTSYARISVVANIGPINTQVSVSTTSCATYEPIFMNVLSASDGDGEDLPLYYVFSLEMNGKFFYSPKKYAPNYTAYCLDGLTKAGFKICDTIQTCYLEDIEIKTIQGRELQQEDNLQLFQEVTLNVDNIPGNVYLFSKGIPDVGQELFNEMNDKLAWYISVQTEINVELAYSLQNVYSGLLSQSKYITDDLVMQYLRDTLQILQTKDLEITGDYYEGLVLNFKSFIEELPQDKLDEALSLIGAIGRQTLKTLLPEAVQGYNDYSNQSAVAARITNSRMQNAVFVLDDLEITFPDNIQNAKFLGVDFVCSKYNVQEALIIACEAIESGEFRDNHDGIFSYQQYQDPIPLQTSGLWTIQFKRPTKKVYFQSDYECISKNQCTIVGSSDDYIIVQTNILEVITIAPTDTYGQQTVYPAGSLELETDYSCKTCYGPFWALVGISGALIFGILAFIVIQIVKRKHLLPDPITSTPHDPQTAATPRSPTDYSIDKKLKPMNPKDEPIQPTLEPITDRKWFFGRMLFIEIFLTDNNIKRIYNILALYTILLLEFAILGLLYFLVGDYDEDSQVYDISDAIDDYDFYDFGLAISSVLIIMPISGAVQYLILNEYMRNRIYIALGIDFLASVAAVLLILGFTSIFCCKAAALWTTGLLFIVICELLFSEISIALLRLFIEG